MRCATGSPRRRSSPAPTSSNSETYSATPHSAPPAATSTPMPSGSEKRSQLTPHNAPCDTTGRLTPCDFLRSRLPHSAGVVQLSAQQIARYRRRRRKTPIALQTERPPNATCRDAALAKTEVPHARCRLSRCRDFAIARSEPAKLRKRSPPRPPTRDCVARMRSARRLRQRDSSPAERSCRPPGSHDCSPREAIVPTAGFARLLSVNAIVVMTRLAARITRSARDTPSL